MQMHSAKSSQSLNTQWRGFLERLSNERPLLVREFVRSLLDSGEYQQYSLPLEELNKTAYGIFTLLIEELSDNKDDDCRHGLARQIAHSRVLQGVPLEAVMNAINLDFSVLWRRLKGYAGNDHLEVLVEHVEELSYVVSRFIADLREQYALAQARITRDLSIIRKQHLARLFATMPLEAQDEAAIERGLELDGSGAFRVMISTIGSANTLQQQASEALAVGTLYGHQVGERFVVFHSTNVDFVHEQLHGVAVLSADQIQGIRQVREFVLRSQKLLSLLCDNLEPGCWKADDLILRASGAFVGKFLPESSVSRIPSAVGQGADAEQLLETVRVYFETGSIKAVASRVHCHRNTVVNRLKSFESITGFDVTVPLEAAKVITGLAVHLHKK